MKNLPDSFLFTSFRSFASVAAAAALVAATTGCKKDEAKNTPPAPGPNATVTATPAPGTSPVPNAPGEAPAGAGSAGAPPAAPAGKPAEAGAKPAAEGEKPAEAGAKPAAEGAGPAEGAEKAPEAAADGGEKPAEEGEKPAEGGADSAEAAADSGEKPADPAADPAAAKPEAAPAEAGAEPENKDPTVAPKDVAAPPPDALRTKSGLASKVLRPGKSDKTPSPEDTVKVHYTGWTTDGKMFDSSRTRGEPTSFPLNAVIAGWTEGVGLMKVGESRRFWIPEGLAYQGRPGAPAGMLVFDVELLEIMEKPKAPSDVAEPPADAERTSSGLASKVLRAGTGNKRPVATDTVSVHYSGWTTDGKMFDSSVARGEPAAFPLNRVIPGWTEGVALMVEGERRRLWIPEELAYKGRPGAPAGMLVFDVELISIGAPR